MTYRTRWICGGWVAAGVAFMAALAVAADESPMIYSQPHADIPLEDRNNIELMDVQCDILLPDGRTGKAYVPPGDDLLFPFQQYYDTGLVFLSFDRNNDGWIDYAIFYQTHRGKRMPYPLFYMEDLNGDDWMDFTYIDQYGWGRCEDIVIYSNKAAPKDYERRQPEMKGGQS